MRPHVVLHTETSLDGKVNGFSVDMGTYYRLAETFEPDAALSGSGTILAADMPDPVPDWCFQAAGQYPSCSRMVMAIVDSGGRVRNWNAIKKQPFWKVPLALVSESTPAEYLEYLEKEEVPYIVAGVDRVDLAKALEVMQRDFGVNKLRIDSGGTLSALMLAQGLVDEISMILSPFIAGGLATSNFLDASALNISKPLELTLTHSETLEDGRTWLRYSVRR